MLLAICTLLILQIGLRNMAAARSPSLSLRRPFLPRTFLAPSQTILQSVSWKDTTLRIRGGGNKRNKDKAKEKEQYQRQKKKHEDAPSATTGMSEAVPTINNKTVTDQAAATATKTPTKSIFSESAKDSIMQNLEMMQQLLAQFGPTILTILALVASFQSGQNKRGVTFLTLYGLALLGASCGFHLFLYFITVGFALGVTLPLAVSLFVYHKQYKLPTLTLVHSLVTILWGLRLFTFLTWREYVSWPALHQKVVEVQAKMNIPFASKLLCWFVYSFFYVALMASCWSRLLQIAALSTVDPSVSSSPSVWGFMGILGLLMQSTGLVLETVADAQKNAFKSRHLLSWCHVGLWKFSTHPNYLGEGLFWWGTYLAHGFHSILPSLLATSGLVFLMVVLKGASRSLASKQKEKYGQDEGFLEFQRSHNVFGPKKWWLRKDNTTSLEASNEDSIGSNDVNVTATPAAGSTSPPS